MITVEEFMTRNPYALRENDSLYDARKVMTEKHIRHIPIIDEDKKLLGLVTQRDILAATDPSSALQSKSAPDSSGSDIMLSDIMIRNVTVIREPDSLRQAALHIQAHKHGCLPVVSGGSLVGIITDSDFIDIAINLLEQQEVSEETDEMGTDDLIGDVEMFGR